MLCQTDRTKRGLVTVRVIAKQVWRKGWRQEAAATQAASAELAACLDWLEQNGFGDSAKTIREIAMEFGACKTVAAFGAALRRVGGKQP
jgi:hypothetical protein